MSDDERFRYATNQIKFRNLMRIAAHVEPIANEDAAAKLYVLTTTAEVEAEQREGR